MNQRMSLGLAQSWLILLAMSAISGCAIESKPMVFQTESTLGRVVRITDAYQSPPGYADAGVPVMVGGAVVVVRNDSNQQLINGYEIASLEGQVLVAYSKARFLPGECVRLWHEPLAPFSDNPGFNVVAGTLVKASECPQEGIADR